jgi:hypothetical protein
MATAASAAPESSQPGPSPPARRWRRPTPGWAILGLLAAEGLLWLSERFRWFAFNEHKGWTVLFALAAVGLTLVGLLLWFAASLLLRWRFQFSLRSLLALVLVVALPCSWLAVECQRANKQRLAAAAIEREGGDVVYDYEHDAFHVSLANAQPPAPGWLRRALGDDFFSVITCVRCGRRPTADRTYLRDLTQLQWLSLSYVSTSSLDLECIVEAASLTTLFLDDTRVTDSDLRHLRHLKNLRNLSLSNTPVRDAGLEHLEGLTQLRALDLSDTRVTDAGLRSLRAMKELRRLHLGGTRVTDGQMEYLRGLTDLRFLSLRNTEISDASMPQLSGLTRLEKLNLYGTHVTEAGLVYLKELYHLRGPLPANMLAEIVRLGIPGPDETFYRDLGGSGSVGEMWSEVDRLREFIK